MRLLQLLLVILAFSGVLGGCSANSNDEGTSQASDAGSDEACEPPTDAELCLELGKDCDELRTVDRCSVTRELNCGICTNGTACGGGGAENVCGSSAGPCVPSSSVPSGWSYLDNGIVRVGVDLDYGAAVGYFAAEGSNVLDSNDSGRYLQQSYYGDQFTGSWHGDPWPFNPVQGGSSEGDPSPVTEFCNNGTTLYAKTTPMDWGGTGLTPFVMEEWLSLDGDVAILRFRFEYLGDWSNQARHQEVPALFVRRDLENLTYYRGNAPWTGGEVTKLLPNQLETQGNQYIDFDEPWLAFLDASNWGVGLYKRGEDSATCYRYKSIGENGATSYFAFLDTFALTPSLTQEYTLYAKIGTLAELRSEFLERFQQGL